MQHYTSPLEPGNYYHIYNHAVGKDNLFLNDDNYNFFLKKYNQYISPIANTFAYCLMPNHFHFFVRIKEEKEIDAILKTLPKFRTLAKLENKSDRKLKIAAYEKYSSKQFSNLFSSYTQAFNKQQNRKGTLFQKPFKRKQITDESYLKNMIHYIHYNPVHHGFVDNLRNWKHSSFESFFSDKETQLQRDEVMEMFDNKENFFAFHQNEVDEKGNMEFD